MNYTTEKNKFLREWQKLNEAYKAEGADAETIEAIYQEELNAFRERIKEGRHSVYVDFDEFPVTEEQFDEDRCLTLLDTIENPLLLAALRRLKPDDLSLLCDVVVEGYSQKEAADMRKLSLSTINYRYHRILRECRDYMAKHSPPKAE